jgi:hypothetical protein
MRIPDIFDASTLARELRSRIAGTPADGSIATRSSSHAVIWVDAGSEVVAYLESLQTRLLKGTLLVSIDLESDQTGRSPLIVSINLSADPHDPAGLVATTDEYPRGDGQLAARWGRPLQAAVWASLLSLAQDHAVERSGAPRSIFVAEASLTLQAGPPLSFLPKAAPERDDGYNREKDDATTSSTKEPS